MIRSGTTVDQMVRAIGDRIVTGYLRPGEKLDEASLAARFDVSRTPVREALGQLSAMGLVERRPNRGAIVAVVTQEHLASMFESMAELEAICARFSAERMTSSERRGLEIDRTEAIEAAELKRRDAIERRRIDVELALESERIASSRTREVLNIDQKKTIEIAPFVTAFAPARSASVIRLAELATAFTNTVGRQPSLFAAISAWTANLPKAKTMSVSAFDALHSATWEETSAAVGS